MTWLDACRDLIRREKLAPELGTILLAFGGEDAPGAAELDAPLPVEELPRAIEAELAAEVDAEQAGIFARRFGSVSELLARQERSEARLLRVCLYRRAAQILDAPRPRALRVRALVDFLWSQAALLEHAGQDAPTLTELAAEVIPREFAPGLRHGRIRGLTRRGPVNINLLFARGARLEAIGRRGQGSLSEAVREAGAQAAISGGFFLYSEPDIELPSRRTDPVGLFVQGGRVVGPPVFHRASLLYYAEGRVALERVGMEGVAVSIGAERFEVGKDARLVNRAHARRSEPREGEVGIAIVGDCVLEVSAGPLAVPLSGFVLWTAGSEAQPGDQVGYDLARPGLETAMGGGPLLLGVDALDLVAEEFSGSAPPLTFSRDETYDQNLLPRLGVGLTVEGELIAAAVDGRDREALGLTLGETGALLETLGCVRAINLDGGSSKRMLIGERVVDLSSTEVQTGERRSSRVRPVHSALLFHAG